MNLHLPHLDLAYLLHLDLDVLDFDGYGDLLAELDMPRQDAETMQAIRRFAASGDGIYRRTVKWS